MENRHAILNEIEETFDLKRIQELSVPEKFKLVDFVGFIYQEAHHANQVGLLKLDQSVHYNDNRTYKLYAMLVSNGTKYEMLKKIIFNYSRNFDRSDVYYAQTLIIGIGLMMIDKGFEPDAVYNYLMHILGKSFLTDNLKYNGIVNIKKDVRLDVSREIEYKPFEGNMRQIKYDILAILMYAHQHSVEDVKALINNNYDNAEFKFYFNLLNIPCIETRRHIYNHYEGQESRTQRLMLDGAYAILQKLDLFTAHYLFNSIIGKYSRYEKESQEIKNEAQESLDRLLAMPNTKV